MKTLPNGILHFEDGEEIRCERLSRDDKLSSKCDIVCVDTGGLFQPVYGWNNNPVRDKEAYRICDTGDIVLRIQVVSHGPEGLVSFKLLGRGTK